MKIHDKQYVCDKKPKRSKYRYGKSNAADKIRCQHRWTETSIAVRERDHFLCVVCRIRDNTLTYANLSVHHIVPIEEDEALAFDFDNLITVCRYHHDMAEIGRISREELREMLQEYPPGVKSKK